MLRWTHRGRSHVVSRFNQSMVMKSRIGERQEQHQHRGIEVLRLFLPIPSTVRLTVTLTTRWQYSTSRCVTCFQKCKVFGLDVSSFAAMVNKNMFLVTCLVKKRLYWLTAPSCGKNWYYTKSKLQPKFSVTWHFFSLVPIYFFYKVTAVIASHSDEF